MQARINIINFAVTSALSTIFFSCFCRKQNMYVGVENKGITIIFVPVVSVKAVVIPVNAAVAF